MTFAIKFLQDRGYPHIEHPREVLQILVDAGITDPTVHLAALLHDIRDYTDTTNDEIAESFGSVVAGITGELFLDMKNPSSNFLVEVLNSANTLSQEATDILVADLVFSLEQVQQFKIEKEHYNRNIFAWVREVVSKLDNPNPVLMDRLNSAFDGIYERFQNYPRNETQKDVWQEMQRIVEGRNDDIE